jgi:hypothetical protein
MGLIKGQGQQITPKPLINISKNFGKIQQN